MAIFCFLHTRQYAIWEHQGIFGQMFVEMDGSGALAAMAIVLLAALLARFAGGMQLVAGVVDRKLTIVTAAAFLVFLLGTSWVYHAFPLSMDEFAPLSQAASFAQGELSWRYPPDLATRMIDPAFLNGAFFVNDAVTGEMASGYWPGFALLITPFYLAGVPWAINPLIGALGLIVVHRLASRLTGASEAGGWAVLFCLGSPAYVLNAMSMYSMNAHLVGNLVWVLLVLDPTPRRLFLAGLLGGLLLALHNPVPHALFVAPWLLWLAFRPGGLRLASSMVAGYLPGVLVLGVGWALFLGRIASGLDVVPAGIAPGSASYWVEKLASVFSIPPSTRLFERVTGLCKLLLWAVPGLVLLAIAGAATWRRSERTPVLLLAASVAITFAGFMFVPFTQGHGWGFRYLHSAWGALPVLAALFVTKPRPESEAQSWRIVVALLAVCSLAVNVPLRLLQAERFIGGHLEKRIQAPAVGSYVVTVRQPYDGYTMDLVQNLPGDTRVIYLISSGPDSDTDIVTRHFPGSTRLADEHRGSLWALSGQVKTP